MKAVTLILEALSFYGFITVVILWVIILAPQ